MKILYIAEPGESLAEVKVYAMDLHDEMKEHKATGFPPLYPTQIYATDSVLLTTVREPKLIGEIQP